MSWPRWGCRRRDGRERERRNDREESEARVICGRRLHSSIVCCFFRSFSWSLLRCRFVVVFVLGMSARFSAWPSPFRPREGVSRPGTSGLVPLHIRFRSNRSVVVLASRVFGCCCVCLARSRLPVAQFAPLFRFLSLPFHSTHERDNPRRAKKTNPGIGARKRADASHCLLAWGGALTDYSSKIRTRPLSSPLFS